MGVRIGEQTISDQALLHARLGHQEHKRVEQSAIIEGPDQCPLLLLQETVRQSHPLEPGQEARLGHWLLSDSLVA